MKENIENMSNTVTISNHDGDTTYELASFGSRFIGRIIDVAIIFIPALYIPIIPPWLYFSLQHCSESQATVGQKAMDIMVIDIEGHKVEFAQASGRFFGNFLNLFTLGGGILMFFFNNNNQCLHDYVSNCLVVRKQPLESSSYDESGYDPSKVTD